MSTHNQLQVTYNQIIAKLQEFVDQHEQIETFGNGDIWEAVEHNQDTPFKYPLMWAQDNTWTISDRTVASGSSTIEATFTLFVMDLVNKDESNENEVMSDTLQCLLDLQAYIERDADTNWDLVQLVRNTSMNPFTESLNDEVSGWTYTLTLKQPMIFDSCGVVPNLGNDIFIKGLFAAGDDTMETLTIDSDSAGTYTLINDDGGSGDITLNINGGGDAAFVNPTVLSSGDTVIAKRTVTTSAGFYKIVGTY